MLAIALVSCFSWQMNAGRFGCCSSSAVDVYVPGAPAEPAKPVLLSVVVTPPSGVLQRASDTPSSVTSSGHSVVTEHIGEAGSGNGGADAVVVVSDHGAAVVVNGGALPRLKKVHLRRIAAAASTTTYTPSDLDDLDNLSDVVCVEDSARLTPTVIEPTLFSKSNFRSSWKKTRVRVHDLKDAVMAFRWQYTLSKDSYPLDFDQILSSYAQVEASFQQCLDHAQELRMGSKRKSPCGFSREYAQPAETIGLMYLGGMVCNAALRDGGTCKNSCKYEEFKSTCVLCGFDNIKFCFEQESCHDMLQGLMVLVQKTEHEIDNLIEMLPDLLSVRR